SERHPSYGRLAYGKKRYQGRRVSRISAHTVRNPEPFVRCIGPTSVVIRCISPWLVRNPGQAERVIHPPIARLIRRPSRLGVRMPSIAVVTYVLPVTIVVEVLDTGNILAHVVIAEIAIGRIVMVRIGDIRVPGHRLRLDTGLPASHRPRRMALPPRTTDRTAARPRQITPSLRAMQADSFDSKAPTRRAKCSPEVWRSCGR